jgi:hypothetical protein
MIEVSFALACCTHVNSRSVPSGTRISSPTSPETWVGVSLSTPASCMHAAACSRPSPRHSADSSAHSSVVTDERTRRGDRSRARSEPSDILAPGSGISP